MSGGSVRHGIITANVIAHLNNQLAERDCTVTSSDVRVYIASKNAYRYPDVTVFCGEPAFVQGHTDTIMNPVVLVEVLSSDTILDDCGEKLHEYLQIDSLQAYLLVEQHVARVERYMRHEAGNWLYTTANTMDAEIALPSIDCILTLSKVYHKVSFDEAKPDEHTNID